MNLLAALPRIDLTDRDFSECAMPYAYLYRRDLTGSKNLRIIEGCIGLLLLMTIIIIIDYFID
jgi:hypothetical protein